MQIFKQAIRSKDILQIKHVLNMQNIQQHLNTPDKQGQTAIFYACVHQDEQFALQVVQMLLHKGANAFHKQENKETILYYLARDGRVKLLQRMLELPYNLKQQDIYCQTALFFAAKNNRLKISELLIKSGININHIDSNGQTCLFYAAGAGHLEMCKLLINRGCYPLLQDYKKQTAINYARKSKNMHLVDYLKSFKIQQKKEEKKNSSYEVKEKNKNIQVIRKQYVLVYTASNGKPQELNQEQIQAFIQQNQANAEVYNLMQNPQQLKQKQIPSQKKFIKKALKILSILSKNKDALIFLQPVNYQQLNLYNYLDLITNPMDFSTIKNKLYFNCYQYAHDFQKDVKLVFQNCITYNGIQSYFGRIAKQIQLQFEQLCSYELL